MMRLPKRPNAVVVRLAALWSGFALIASAFVIAEPAASQTQPDRAGLARLEREIERLSPIAQGRVGVGVIHLESGRELFLNGSEPFPMASVFKVPAALTLFNLVDEGRIRLDSMVTLKPSDLHPGSGEITHLLNDPGVSLSLLNLLELSLLISDNSAADLVLQNAGGGPAVNARLAALGVTGISVDRSALQLIGAQYGLDLPPDYNWRANFPAAAREITDAMRAAARARFLEDPRDQATPEAMARLLEKLWRGQTLSATSTDQLLDVMFRCETGASRIKGMLPPGTRVAHKTGTFTPGVANDAGIIELPNGAGHVVLAVFVKASTASSETQERAIAQIARAVFDYFVFVPAAKS